MGLYGGEIGRFHPFIGHKALRESSGIALFLTSALEGGEGSASRPGRTLPPGKTRYPLYRKLGGPQGRSPPPGFDPRTFQSVGSRYTDYSGEIVFCSSEDSVEKGEVFSVLYKTRKKFLVLQALCFQLAFLKHTGSNPRHDTTPSVLQSSSLPSDQACSKFMKRRKLQKNVTCMRAT